MDTLTQIFNDNWTKNTSQWSACNNTQKKAISSQNNITVVSG